MDIVLVTAGRKARLPDKPLGAGGEAGIYELPADRGARGPAQVAKIYHKPQPRHAEKLEVMLAHPPADPMAGTGHVSIAWPTDWVTSGDGQKRFLGFVMPRVQNAFPMFEFYNPRSRLQRCPLFHYRYLLWTARNVSAAVRAVHERGHVVGDLNESNVLVKNDALVTLVDTDSFQVTAGGRAFRCPVGKPEYTAPELQGANFPDVTRGPEHDNFALGVLIFQLLMQGMHPFLGRFVGAGEPGPLGDRITAGHWPYLGKGKVPYEPNPHAPPFSTLPKGVQSLMWRCFAEGHSRPAARPGASEWLHTLKDADAELATCRTNAQHVYADAGDGCPWCVIAKRQKRDPFPSKDAIRKGLTVLAPPKKAVAVTRPQYGPTSRAPSAAGAKPASPSRPGPSPSKPTAPANPPYIPLTITPYNPVGGGGPPATLPTRYPNRRPWDPGPSGWDDMKHFAPVLWVLCALAALMFLTIQGFGPNSPGSTQNFNRGQPAVQDQDPDESLSPAEPKAPPGGSKTDFRRDPGRPKG